MTPWGGGGGESFAAAPVSITAGLALLAMVPFAFMMLTSFSKIAVVLSLVRSALGVQQAPPTVVLTGLSAVLSLQVMAPVVEAGFGRVEGEVASVEAHSGARWLQLAREAMEPLQAFLLRHGDAAERAALVETVRTLRPEETRSDVQESDWTVVVTAFVLTELKEAFRIGFLVFLPFLVLDMLMANILLALGMQTLSPSQVSLPFKLLLFVAADGWGLIARGLLLGYQ